MSARPDRPGDDLARFVDALAARVRITRITQACLAGAIVALTLLLVGLTLGPAVDLARSLVLPLALVAGTVVTIALVRARRRLWSAAAIAADAERLLPDLRNHLVTALELDANPDRASPAIRALVMTYASRVVGRASIDELHPRRQALAAVGGIALVIAGGALAWGLIAEPSRMAPRSRSAGVATTAAAPAGLGRVDIVVTAPPYTIRPEQKLRDPERLEMIAGSVVDIRVASRAPTVRVELGQTVAAARRNDPDTVRSAVQPAVSGVLSIAAQTADGRIVDRRLVPVVVHPDAPPEVTIEHPRSDLMFERPTTRVAFSARATDDLGVASLTLHYTKVTGSGEQYAFKEGELPLALVRESPTRWRGDVTRELTALDLKEGDLLVYFARARDHRPGAEPSVSDSYVIEIGKPNAAIAGGFAVPPEEDKAALSMSALIAKTERVHATRARLSSTELSDRTASLAVEQRMVRSETLFLMGAHGEVEDEEAEAEHSNEIQEGRLENRGQADLREATRLMSTAERSLLLADTGAALPVQRAALAAMQRALSKQRYFLRTLPVRSQIDLTRRLSGDLSGARPWQRRGEGVRPDERAADARRLLSDLAGYASARAGDPGDLVRRLIALDPESMTLQTAARDLERLAGPGLDWTAAPHRDTLARIVSAVQQQVSRLPATPPAPSAFQGGSLRGAFADALRKEGAQR